MSEANAVGHWQYDLNTDIVYVMAVKSYAIANDAHVRHALSLSNTTNIPHLLLAVSMLRPIGRPNIFYWLQFLYLLFQLLIMIEVYVNGDIISTSRVRFLVACQMCNNDGRDVDEISHPCVSFCKHCNLVPLLSHGRATKCVCVCVCVCVYVCGTRFNRCRVTGIELLYLYFTTRGYMYILDANNNNNNNNKKKKIFKKF